MSERTTTRRTVLKATGATLAGATIPTTAAAAADGWTAVESPTGNTLHDVEATSAGAYAVGGGGIVLERTTEGWRAVLDGGPTGNGNNLYGADVTNNFNDVSVTGTAGEANVSVAGDSGKAYYSFENGESGSWDSVTPGSGSALNAIDFHDDRAGHIVDDNKRVFATTDGRTWDALGIADANYNFYGVDSDGANDLRVVGGGGTAYHWNGSEWVRDDTGDASLRDVEVEGGDGLAVGGSGAVFAYDGTRWTAMDTPTGSNLKAVVRDTPDIAVGAGGTVIER